MSSRITLLTIIMFTEEDQSPLYKEIKTELSPWID